MKQLCALIVCSCLAAPVAAQPAPDARAGSIGGRVIRPDGIPQPEAEVLAATRHADGRLRASPWRTRTAFDGRYEIAGVPAGRYLVLVRVVGGDAPMQGRPLATLFPGVATTEPARPSKYSLACRSRVWTSGCCPRRAGSKWRAGWSIIWAATSNTFRSSSGRRGDAPISVWTVTEPGGLFTMSGVPPGPVVLRARAEGPSGPLIGLASTELAIESVQDLRIVVRDPGRVRGRVHAPGGIPLPEGVRLSLVPTILRPSALYPPSRLPPARRTVRTGRRRGRARHSRRGRAGRLVRSADSGRVRGRTGRRPCGSRQDARSTTSLSKSVRHRVRAVRPDRGWGGSRTGSTMRPEGAA